MTTTKTTPEITATTDLKAFKSANQLLRAFNATETCGINSDRSYYLNVFFAHGTGPIRNFHGPYAQTYEINRQKGVSKIASYRAFFQEHLWMFLDDEASRHLKKEWDAKFDTPDEDLEHHFMA